MPFTFSHPAAIVPFRLLPKHWTSLTGLVIGSMCPDFEYFIRMKGYGLFGHSWAALFYFGLPLSLALSFIYHLVVRDTFIDNLPGFLQKRLAPFKNFDWVSYFKKHYLIVMVSILIGGCTHVLWDGFTHRHGVFVRRNPWFNQAFIIDGYIFTRYIILQHASSVVGGIIILIVLLQMPIDKNFVNKKSILPYWLSVTIITLVVTVIRLLFLTGNEWKNYNVFIVTVIAGWFIGLIVTPKLLSLKRRAG